jgi:hypothetical protein
MSLKGRGVGALAIAFALLLVLTPAPAQAYVGPGGVISAIGAMFALLAAILASIVGFLWFPLKRLIVWIKGRTHRKSVETPPAASEAAPR